MLYKKIQVFGFPKANPFTIKIKNYIERYDELTTTIFLE